MSPKNLTRAAFSLFLTAAFVAPSSLAGLTIDEVLDRHVEARGGGAWNDIDVLRIEGTYTAFSKPSPATVIRAREGYRADISWNEHPVTIGWDGDHAWWINEMFELPWPRGMSGQDLIALEVDLDFPNALFVARDRGYELSLDEDAEFEGRAMVAVSLKRPSGQEETWYLDPETWLEVAREAPASEFGRPDRQVTFFDDFRPVGEVLVPHYEESQWYTRTRMLEVDSVTLDPELADDLFSRPSPPGMEALAALEGEWKVRVEQRQSPAAPWNESVRESEVVVRLHGALVEETYTTANGTPVVASMTYDPYRETYRFTTINETFPFLDVLEGAAGEGGAIVVDNTGSGTSLPRGETEAWTRMTYRDLSADGFSVDSETSRDGGETWFQDARLTYVRPDAEFPSKEEDGEVPAEGR